MLVAVLVDAHLLERLRVADAIPDEIVAPVAGPQVVVEARDRIADHLLALGQEEHEIGKDARERLRARGRPRSARRARCNSRNRSAAPRGATWARTPERMPSPPTSRSARSTRPSAKCTRTPLPVLLDALEGVAEVVVRGIDGRAQQALQPVPGGEDLPQRAARR